MTTPLQYAYPVLAERLQPEQFNADDLGPDWQCIMEIYLPEG